MMRLSWIAVLILILVYVSDGAFRRSKLAKQITRTRHDAGTSFLLLLQAALSIFVIATAPGASWMQLAGGLVVMAMGAALRYWAMYTLGSSYTRTLTVQTNQRVIEDGPFRYIRHPGYAGMILLWLGAALSTGRVTIEAGVVLMILAGYALRISYEERMLASELEGYQNYKRKTAKLVPWVI